MNNLLKKVLFLSSFLFVCLSLSAQEGTRGGGGNSSIAECNLPAPNNLQVDETSTDYFLLSWDPVTGANNYRVIITDDLTGTVVINDYAWTTSYLAEPLTSGKTYRIKVAPVCSNGVDGNFTSEILRTTGVIVVDIVIYFDEMDCNTQSSATPSPNQTLGWDAAYYPISIDESISIIGESNDNSEYHLVIKHVAGNPYAMLGFQENPSGTLVLDQNPGRKTMSENGLDLLKINIVSTTSHVGNQVYLSFNTIMDPPIVEKCMNVEFFEETQDKGLVSDPNIDQFQSNSSRSSAVFPNPTNGGVNIRVPQNTQLEVFDVSGRVWYSADALKGDSLKVDASQWPTGTYFVRTIENNTPIIQRFVKL